MRWTIYGRTDKIQNINCCFLRPQDLQHFLVSELLWFSLLLIDWGSCWTSISLYPSCFDFPYYLLTEAVAESAFPCIRVTLIFLTTYWLRQLLNQHFLVSELLWFSLLLIDWGSCWTFSLACTCHSVSTTDCASGWPPLNILHKIRTELPQSPAELSWWLCHTYFSYLRKTFCTAEHIFFQLTTLSFRHFDISLPPYLSCCLSSYLVSTQVS